jgi:hypothetical protein
MSIFLDLAGVSGTAFFNLLTISGDDGGLGLTDVPGDPTVFRITYVETAGQPATADRLNQLVNTDFGSPIVITALNGGNDPHTGRDETGNGETYVDSTSGSDIIRVAYDVSQACGAGIVVFDTGGNQISAPNPVILYHELSHAFHVAINQIPFPQTACPGNTTDEPAAEIDENVLRTQLGLCQRDVCNHGGGTGSGNTCGGSDGGSDGGPPAGGCAAGNDGCFIVSATTGSAASAEVTSLRQLRDRVALLSGLSAQLIKVIYDEYAQFSPEIAAALQHDGITRQAVLEIVVRPLFAWYTLAGTLALQPTDERAVRQATQDVLNACPPAFDGTAIVALLETLRGGVSLPPEVSHFLREFAPQVQKAARLRFASWAILDPLVQVWDSTTRRLNVVDEVAQWLATAPLEVLTLPSDPERLDRELNCLARFFDFRPTARLQLGQRLAVAWPQATTALARHDFVLKQGV